MSTKKTFGKLGKMIALSLILTVSMVIISGFVVPMDGMQSSAPTGDEGRIILLLWIVNIVNAALISLVVLQSEWRGWPQVLGLSLAFYGVQTVVGQIEAIVFLTPLGENWGAGSVPALTMPLDFIASQFIVGAGQAAIGIPTAAFLFGGKKEGGQADGASVKADMGFRQWLVKAALIMVLYILLYFGFVYFVAWKSPAVQAFYQGTDPGSFLAQMEHVARETPTLIPFQALRALLWMGFSYPLIRMLRNRGWLGALLTGLFLSLPMNIPHIVPNPYMPADVRLAHFIETASSMFIFGIVLFWLLHRPHPNLAAIFKGKETREMKGERKPVSTP